MTSSCRFSVGTLTSIKHVTLSTTARGFGQLNGPMDILIDISSSACRVLFHGECDSTRVAGAGAGVGW